MTIVLLLLSCALLVSIGVSFWRERLHRAVVADLLDRVMARSYGEYVASTAPALKRPLRRRVLTDEEMAEMERNVTAKN